MVAQPGRGQSSCRQEGAAASPVSEGRVPQVGDERHGPLELLDFGASGFNNFPVSVLSKSERCQKTGQTPTVPLAPQLTPLPSCPLAPCTLWLIL